MPKWVSLVWLLFPVFLGAAEFGGFDGSVRQFVLDQLGSFPGQITVSVLPPLYGLKPNRCVSPQLTLPSNAKLGAGRILVSARCDADENGRSWSGMVPVIVTLNAPHVVIRRTMNAGETLTSADVEIQNGAVTRPDVLTRLADLDGKVLRQGVVAGQALRPDMLRLPYIVLQGQTVQVQVMGEGFQVSTQGQALANAIMGQNVQVRAGTGRVLTGVVTGPGTIQVAP
ncbi:MAG: flagellar basal body P-ring formation protein FlgA [Ferrovum sp.]|nr:flagellar basal body P-ring formation protein FlgA [Ferrovum sp.]